MSCKTPISKEKWLHIQNDIALRSCPSCGNPGLDGSEEVPLPFDRSMVSIWTCRSCHQEFAFVISETGDVYRT